MKNYLKLARIKHYLKNILIFIPLFFSGKLLENGNIIEAILGFIVFSLMCSFIYILNDIKDIEKDKLHEVKKKRPIASGKISKNNAIIFAFLLLLLAILIETIFIGFNNYSYIFLILYFILNLGYSLGLKNIPLLDIIILVSGFVLRVAYGATLFDIEVSNWLYLMVLSISFYLALGKRRNELVKTKGETRKVLTYYSKEFLDKSMYMFLTIAIIFYSLWCVDPIIVSNSNNLMLWTVPLIMIMCLKYSMNIENNSHGDPIDVIIKDKFILLLGLIYVACLIIILYFI
ncbi:MAG: UbiA prenyltransferase family protein [Bacilli bacterium]